MFELDDPAEWILAGIGAIACVGVVFALARWLLNIGFGPR